MDEAQGVPLDDDALPWFDSLPPPAAARVSAAAQALLETETSVLEPEGVGKQHHPPPARPESGRGVCPQLVTAAVTAAAAAAAAAVSALLSTDAATLIAELDSLQRKPAPLPLPVVFISRDELDGRIDQRLSDTTPKNPCSRWSDATKQVFRRICHTLHDKLRLSQPQCVWLPESALDAEMASSKGGFCAVAHETMVVIQASMMLTDVYPQLVISRDDPSAPPVSLKKRKR